MTKTKVAGSAEFFSASLPRNTLPKPENPLTPESASWGRVDWELACEDKEFVMMRCIAETTPSTMGATKTLIVLSIVVTSLNSLLSDSSVFCAFLNCMESEMRDFAATFTPNCTASVMNCSPLAIVLEGRFFKTPKVLSNIAASSVIPNSVMFSRMRLNTVLATLLLGRKWTAERRASSIGLFSPSLDAKTYSASWNSTSMPRISSCTFFLSQYSPSSHKLIQAEKPKRIAKIVNCP